MTIEPRGDEVDALDAHHVYEAILRAAERQVATAEVARRIVAAGLRDDLVALLTQVAANAANPISVAASDATSTAVAAATAGCACGSRRP